jgi:hypothetical protein
VTARRWFGAFIVAWVLGSPALALAHGFHPGVLTLVEQRSNVFATTWVQPVDTRGASEPVVVGWPAGCTATGAVVDCSPGGPQGAITFTGLSGASGRVIATVHFLDGTTVETVVRADDPRLVLRAADGPRPLAGGWIELGVLHILTGWDHLAFVIGLLAVVGAANLRRLVATITAFTVAHSLALALAVGGMVTLRPAAVEAIIAASVLLVAREALGSQPTLTRRAPWLVAFVFGLVHGLGFAGALASRGIGVGLSLLWFNVGVELGQLAIVVVAVALMRRFGERHGWLRPVVAYAIGGVAAAWFLERAFAVFTAGS